MKNILQRFGVFMEGKWIMRPCSIPTKHYGLKAMLNILMILPKSLLYLMVSITLFFCIPSLILSPVGVLLIPDDMNNFFVKGIMIYIVLFTIAAVGFVIYVIITQMVIPKYKVYKRYYRMYGHKVK